MKVPTRILLIDDDPWSNSLSKFIINKTFKTPELVSFTDPELALEYMRSEYAVNPVPTVVFLDINMPGLSGWEVLDEFQNLAESVKKEFSIFMLTSSIDMHDKEKADENENVWGYIEKPLTLIQLQSFFADIPGIGDEK